MSSEIEIGEYIRTKYDGIRKVEKIEYDIDTKENYYYFDKLFRRMGTSYNKTQ